MADISIGQISAKLSIDASEWQRGLQQAAQQLSTLQQGLTGRLNPALAATQQQLTTINNTTVIFAQAAQRATSATSAWSSALRIASGIGLATSISGMIAAVVNFGKSVVDTGTRLESLRASLGAIAGSSAAGQQQFNFLTATAKQLGVDLTSLAQGWRTFTAAATSAKLPMEDQQRLLTAIAREAQRTGVSSQGLERGLLALAQSASKGKVSMEEVRQQLSENFPTVFAAMSQGLGRTTAELEKLIETGSVSFTQMVRGLNRGWEQMQQGAGQMAETSQQAFTRLGTALTSFKDQLAQNVLPELARIARVAQSILESATDLLRVTGGRAGPQGPTTQELGAAPAQQAELERLNRVIAQLEARQGAGTPAMQETMAQQLANAKELRDQVLQTVRATTDQAAAESKVATETNKVTSNLQLQKEFLEQIAAKQAEVRAAREAFRAEAALSPERLGRPGTPEFLEGEQRALEKPLSELTALAKTPPAGATLPPQQRAEVLALDAQYGRLGATVDSIREKQREAERAAREAIQEQKRLVAEQERELEEGARQRVAQLRDIIATEDQQFAQLQGLHARYTQVKETVDAGKASELEAALATSTHADQAKRLADEIRGVATIEAQLAGLRREAEASAPAGERAIRAAKDEADALKVLADHLERVRGQRDALSGGPDAADLRIEQRTREKILSPAGREEAGQMQRETARVRQETERVVQVIDMWRELSYGVGSAWTSALTSIADHTKTVGEAFAEMGRSILKTMADIAASQATQALFKLGFGLLTSFLTPTAPGGNYGGIAQGFSTAALPYGYGEFQHGGTITAPTIALLGEAGREHVVPGPQYDQMAAAMSRGSNGQGSNVSIYNFPSKEAAEQAAASDRALGSQIIMNEIRRDLSMGSGSTIYKSLRQIGG